MRQPTEECAQTQRRNEQQGGGELGTERVARDHDDLIEQISITLYHELGHYLGFEEEDMDELGLA